MQFKPTALAIYTLMFGFSAIASGQNTGQATETSSLQTQARLWFTGKIHGPKVLQDLLEKLSGASPSLSFAPEMNSSVTASDGTYITFDAPGGAGNTFPVAINLAGTVLGFTDTGYVPYGFVRYANGSIKVLDISNAGTGEFQGTIPFALNDLGEITGNYTDANSVTHGFLLVKKILGDGYTQITFDPNGSVGTYATAINNFGTIAGYFYDDNYVFHGFVRDVLGKISTFDISNRYNLTVVGISDTGTVTGYFADPNQAYVNRGFVRQLNGAITIFDGPNGQLLDFVNGINPQGDVVGSFSPTIQNVDGFIRRSNGSFVSFSTPGAVYPTAINVIGEVTGSPVSPAGGFFRQSNGSITYFNVPSAYAGSTSPSGINALGTTTGGFETIDPVTFDISYHGFIRIGN